MPRSPASIIPILDQSDSMKAYGYFASAKVDLANFVNILQGDDSFAVLGFSDNLERIYPTTATLVSGGDEIVNATSAVASATSLNMTNMSAPITAANALLQSRSNPRGMVLLSDGYWNKGVDPTTVINSGIPIFTIAEGTNGQTSVLESLSRLTGGTYQLTPDSVGLASIYFDIISEAKVATTMSNRERSVSPSAPTVSLTSNVAAAQDVASFAVNWANSSIPGVQGPPGAGQIGIQLYDPNFNLVTATVRNEGDGFMVLQVSQPLAGTWTLQATYNGTETINVTLGSFEPDMQNTLALEAHTRTPATGSVTKVHANLDLTDNAQLVHVNAWWAAPTVIRERAESCDDKPSSDSVDPRHLADSRLDTGIGRRIAVYERAVPTATADSGSASIHLGPFESSGIHKLTVEAYVKTPNDVQQRTRVITFDVRDS